MGAQACTCAEVAPRVSEVGSKVDSNGVVVGAWSPQTKGPLEISGSKSCRRLAGGANTSWLVARGCVIRLRWSSVGKHLSPAPPATLPDVLFVQARVVQIAAGEGHALILAVAGSTRVFSVGNNEYGQLGLGDTLKRAEPGKTWEVNDFSAGDPMAGVACGGHVSFAMSSRGDVWSWGRNEESGVLGQGAIPVACIATPHPVVNLRGKLRTVQVATSGWTAMCVSHRGAVYSWGGGLCGVHGLGHQQDEPSAKAVRQLEDVPIAQVCTGPLHAVALSMNGEAFTWGRVAGAFGSGVQLQLFPKLIDALVGVHLVQVSAGGDHSLALSKEGDVFAWGAYMSGEMGDLKLQDPMQPYAFVHKLQLGSIGRVLEVACGKHHSLFLTALEEQGGGRDHAGDMWLCGSMGLITDHVASQRDGTTVAAYGWGRILAPPPNVPLKMTRVDVKRVFHMMG